MKANMLTLDKCVWNNFIENHLDELAAIVGGVMMVTFLANLLIAIIAVFIEDGRFLLLLSAPVCDH